MTGNGSPPLRNVRKSPVTQSSRHAQIGEEGNMAASSCRLQITVKLLDLTCFRGYISQIQVCMYLDNVTRPVYELLDCSLVDLTKFSCPRLSVELDPLLAGEGVGDWL